MKAKRTQKTLNNLCSKSAWKPGKLRKNKLKIS